MFEDAKTDDKINMTVGEFTKAIADTRREALEEAIQVCDKANKELGWAHGGKTALDVASRIRSLIGAERST